MFYLTTELPAPIAVAKWGLPQRPLMPVIGCRQPVVSPDVCSLIPGVGLTPNNPLFPAIISPPFIISIPTSPFAHGEVSRVGEERPIPVSVFHKMSWVGVLVGVRRTRSGTSPPIFPILVGDKAAIPSAWDNSCFPLCLQRYRCTHV